MVGIFIYKGNAYEVCEDEIKDGDFLLEIYSSRKAESLRKITTEISNNFISMGLNDIISKTDFKILRSTNSELGLPGISNEEVNKALKVDIVKRYLYLNKYRKNG